MENLEKKYSKNKESLNFCNDIPLKLPEEILRGLTSEEKKRILNGKIQKIFENINTYLPL